MHRNHELIIVYWTPLFTFWMHKSSHWNRGKLMSFNVCLWTQAWCALSMCLVKIVCVRKFVFKPTSPEYVVSRKPNKGITNYLAIPTLYKQRPLQHCQKEKYPEESNNMWSSITLEECVSFPVKISLLKTFSFCSKRNKRKPGNLILQKKVKHLI